jgi:hypothetical protein
MNGKILDLHVKQHGSRPQSPEKRQNNGILHNTNTIVRVHAQLEQKSKMHLRARCKVHRKEENCAAYFVVCPTLHNIIIYKLNYRR